MSIGDDVKNILEANDELAKRIHGAFENALLDIKSKGIEIENRSDYQHSLNAIIGDYLIEIPYDDVLKKVKHGISKGTPILDEKIKNVLNELIRLELES